MGREACALPSGRQISARITIASCWKLPADVNHAAGRLQKSRFANVMTSFFLCDYRVNISGHVLVRSAAEHLSIEIMIEKREQASTNLAVGGDANARAMSTKRMGDGGDNANFSEVIVESIAAGSFAAVVRL